MLRGALASMVLPALVLRALIPVGFMPVSGNGGLTMELCPGAVAMAEVPFAQRHHGVGSGASGGAARALCVFAASAAPAVTPVVPPMSLIGPRTRPAIQAATPSISLPSILRSQSARAPPDLT